MRFLWFFGVGSGSSNTSDRTATPTSSTTTVKPALAFPSNSSSKTLSHTARNETGNKTNKSFYSAKKTLTQTVYSGKLLKQETFYCGCNFNTDKEVDVKGCNYKPKNTKYTGRDQSVEWEHVVPISWYSQYFKEWSDKDSFDICKSKKLSGRSCAERLNDHFALMQADLYNLQPSVGTVNMDRSNKAYGTISGESYKYGSCNYESSSLIAEPREEVQGDIARTIFYMADAYNYDISGYYNEAELQKWDKEDPVSVEECKRYLVIKKLQGNDNKILKERCSK